MTQRTAMAWDLPTLLRDVPGRKAFQHPLAPYTSFRIGGPADALVRVESEAALRQVQAIATAQHIPLFIMGGGTNLLIRDGGVRGIVVMLHGAFRTYQLEADAAVPSTTAQVHVGVGVAFSRLALQMARQGWSGLEFAYGIPGTLGGAMVMNAGTYLGDLSQVLRVAHMLDRNGQVQALSVDTLGLRYRSSSYPAGAILLAATLHLQRGEAPVIEATMHTSYEQRQRAQPLTLPNAGSIFKNPPGMAAGRLIDTLGLKGTRMGGAEISPIHANFIVNVARATAADVEALMAYMQERVHAAYDIVLEPEVRLVGEKV